MPRKGLKKTHKHVYADALFAETIALVDKDGNTRTMFHTANGLPQCIFFDRQMITRIAVGMDTDDTPFICLLGESSKAQITLHARKDGPVGIGIYDEDGNQTFWAGVDLNASRHVTLFDKDGKVLWNTSKDSPVI